MAATEEFCKSLESEGYAIAESVLGKGELERVRLWIRELVSRGAEVPLSLEPEFEKAAEGQTALVRKVRRLFWYDPKFWADIFRSSCIRDMAEGIVGSSTMLILHAAFLKPAHFGSATPPHQDQALWEIDYPGAVSMWVAIDPATHENGCLQMYPGSHRLGCLPHSSNGGHPRVDVSRIPINPQEAPLRQGDAVLWHRYTLHASEPNRSAQNRWGMVMVFANGADRRFDAYDRFPLRQVGNLSPAALTNGTYND